MSEKTFKASSGYEIVEEGGELFVYDKRGVFYTNITATFGDTLREYFQHVRDTELGRARWPEDPDYVIYRVPKLDDDKYGRCVNVLHEPSTFSRNMWEWWPSGFSGCALVREAAVRWYFAEGPGKTERPWEGAQPGEVWRIGLDGQADTFMVWETVGGTPYFSGQASSFETVDVRITAGRKLLEADGTPTEGDRDE